MNEFVKLLVWQMAQILGYEGQSDLAEHSILLLVDYDRNAFLPVFIGRSLETADLGPTIPWDENVRILTTYVIAEEYRNEIGIFMSEQAARRKYEKQRLFDAVNYVSMLSNGKKWTHCIQSLFTSADSLKVLAQRLKADLPFADSPGILFLDIPESASAENAEPHLMSFFLVIEVDAIRKSLESLRYLARHDQLTGLYNRHMMAEIVDDSPSSVIIIDIDKFKSINDGYGHAAGDEALCALANRLEVIFWHHNRDMIFRLGGDEFLVVMKGDDDAEPYIQQLCEPMAVTTSENQCMNLTVSVGCARCTDNFKAALKAADTALYKVKENGRNGYRMA